MAAPVTPQAVPRTTSQAAPDVAVPLGGGLNGVIDWQRDFPFPDLVKQTRGFKKLKDIGTDAETDERGWPAEDFWVRVSDNGAPVGAGVYKLSFTGPEGVEVNAGASGAKLTKTGYDAATGATSYDVEMNAQSTVLEFNFVNTQGQVKNLRVLRPGYDPQKPPTFSSDFLAMIRSLHPTVLRFMDWKATNGTVETRWADRALPNDATQTSSITRPVPLGKLGEMVNITQGRGVAWEYAIELSNTVGSDPWVNIPILADDDYVRNLAQLLKKNLNPNRKIWVEYSNEVWNDQFMQTHSNRNLAVREVVEGENAGRPSSLNFDKLPVDKNKTDESAPNSVTWGDRRVAKRLKEISDIFGEVFGPGSINTRIRPVLAYQFAPSRLEQQLNFINKVYGSPNKYFYALAVAPYFEAGNGHGADARTDLTKDEVLAQLEKSIAEQAPGLEEIQAIAVRYGLKMTAYEGGPDTFGPNNIAAKKAATLDPRMKEVARKYLDQWYSLGGDQFNWFVIGAGSFESRYGTWSITDNLNDLEQPKEQALRAVQISPRPALTAGQLLPREIDARVNLNDPYIRYIGAGATFPYLVRAPQAGDYQFKVSVGTTQDGRKIGIAVNNSEPRLVDVPNTGSEDKFTDTAPISLPLPAGLSVIVLSVPDERPYTINSLKISAPNGAAPKNTLPVFGEMNFFGFADVAPGGTWSQSFTVSDAETPSDKLSVTATSSDQNLLPDGNLTLENEGAKRKLSVQIPANAVPGRVWVTVRAKDEAGATRAVRFVTLTVKAPKG